MSKANWLSTTEYFFIAAAAVGTVATAVTQKPVYAAAPLTVALTLNAINRQATDENVKKYSLAEVNEAEQRLLGQIQLVDERFQALPPPPEPVDLTIVEEKIKADREAIAQLQQHFSQVSRLESLFSEVQNTVDSLKKNSEENTKAIDQAREHLQSLPTRGEVERISQEAFSTLQAKQKTSEESIFKFTEQIEALSSRIAELSLRTESIDMKAIEQNVLNLNEQIGNLYAQYQYQDRVEQGEIESLKSTLESGISRSELNLLAEDLERVKQQKQQLEKTIEQLQKAFTQLPPAEEIEKIKEKLDRVDGYETIEITQPSGSLDAIDLQGIEEEIADLRTQLGQMQQQLINRQHSFNELNEEQKPNTDSPRLKKLLTWLNDKF